MLDQIKNIFPIEVEVTQDIIDNSDIHHIFNCIGVNTLKKALGKDLVEKVDRIQWGSIRGCIDIASGSLVIESFKDDASIGMMAIQSPCKITLKFICCNWSR